MKTFKNRNCKLRFTAFTIADTVIDLIRMLPGGYYFWFCLPIKGRNNREVIRKNIADTLLNTLFNDDFISILLKGALDSKGKPRDNNLYHWLLTNVYSDSVKKLYDDWLKLNKQQYDVGI